MARRWSNDLLFHSCRRYFRMNHWTVNFRMNLLNGFCLIFSNDSRKNTFQMILVLGFCIFHVLPTNRRGTLDYDMISRAWAYLSLQSRNLIIEWAYSLWPGQSADDYYITCCLYIYAFSVALSRSWWICIWIVGLRWAWQQCLLLSWPEETTVNPRSFLAEYSAKIILSITSVRT